MKVAACLLLCVAFCLFVIGRSEASMPRNEIVFVQISQTITEGDVLYLICQPAVKKQWRIVWQKNGRWMTPSRKFMTRNEGEIVQVQRALLMDQGQYKCCVQHEQTKQIEHCAVGSVWIRHKKHPRIHYPPQNQIVLSGSVAIMQCITVDLSPAKIVWNVRSGRGLLQLQLRLHANVLVHPQSYKNRYLVEPTRLIVSDVQTMDSGVYECLVEDEKGRVFDRAEGHLKVEDLVDIGDLRNEINSLSEYLLKLKAQQDLREQKEKQERQRVNQFAKRPSELLRYFRRPDAVAMEMDKRNQRYEKAMEMIQQKTMSESSIPNQSPVFSEKLLSEIGLETSCQDVLPADKCVEAWKNRYRTIDASCNNLHQPTWGRRDTPYLRILQPIYEDGFHLPVGFHPNRLYFGYRKPSAREISVELMSSPTFHSHPLITDLFVHWGQFLAHEVLLTSVSFTDLGLITGDNCQLTCNVDLPCFPISLPADEPRINSSSCLPFSRSAGTCFNNHAGWRPHNTPTPRNQINLVTAFIDASNVYGNEPEVAHLVYDARNNDGTLRVGRLLHGYEYMPQLNTSHLFCSTQPTDPFHCFMTGDIRGNQHLVIIALHVALFREHNRLARLLGGLNPHWLRQPGRVFQETRKIISALMQHITYAQWMPYLLGPRGMRELGAYRGYHAGVDPSIANVFAAAAYRFGHSTNQGVLLRLQESGQEIPEGSVSLRQAFFSPSRIIRERGIEPVLRGASRFPSKQMDARQPVDPELTEHLFEIRPNDGGDLTSLDIQRGRDHALPGYNDWRAACGMVWADTFDDLADAIPNVQVRKKLAQLYGHPGNIDAEIGMVLEKPQDGASMGPTARCILVDQFRRLRDGDRFFYRNKGVFTPEQLQELKKMTLARILCNVGDGIHHIQPDLFKIPQMDEFQACSTLPNMDLTAWKEIPGHF